MWYVVEKVFVQTSKEPNRWSDSKRILCVCPDFWRIEKYFRKIWIRYKETLPYVESFHIEKRLASFYTGLGSIDIYITENPLYELEL